MNGGTDLAYYLDASCAVKAYAEERGAGRVEEILDGAAEVYLSRVGVVEVVAAFFGKVRTAEIPREDAIAAVAEFRLDLEGVYRVVELDPATAERATALAERYGLRAYDCLQLATASLLRERRAGLGLPALVFVSSDKGLNGAAQEEGLTVENPAP